MAEDNLDFLLGKRNDPPKRDRVADLERQVAFLTNHVRHVKAENRRLTERVRNMRPMDSAGPRRPMEMSFETMSAIARCLHPDASPSEEERTSAFKLFSAWRVDSRRGEQRRRPAPTRFQNEGEM
jgi:hypothetical protein